MPTPSLLIVPARFKSGKMYSQIPTSGAGDFTVTRATTATRVNASGLIESVASGIPRLDYYTSGGVTGCPALLVEPAATNFTRFVNQMTAQDTPAVSGGLTITTGSTDFLAPDGTNGSINKYVGGAASGVQGAYYTGGGITVTASGQHTFSLFIKAGTTNPLNFCALQFVLFTGGSGTTISYFSLASGTALTAGASIQNYGNGWYRIISAPYTIASGDLSGQITFWMAESNGDLSWPASGALNLTAYTWGAQLEAGSVATSYIPTTTASVTRNADVISVSGAVSGSIGQTEGTLYAEVDLRTTPILRAIIQLDDGTGDNRLLLNFPNTNQLAFYSVNAGSINQIAVGTVITGTHKMAASYSSGSVQIYVDGSFLASGTMVGYPSLSFNNVSIGSRFAGGVQGQFLNDRIRAAALYTTRLTDTQLATLTSL